MKFLALLAAAAAVSLSEGGIPEAKCNAIKNADQKKWKQLVKDGLCDAGGTADPEPTTRIYGPNGEYPYDGKATPTDVDVDDERDPNTFEPNMPAEAGFIKEKTFVELNACQQADINGVPCI